MADDFDNPIFDLEKPDSPDVESEPESLRPVKRVRRHKKANTSQLDLFSQNYSKPQETSHDDDAATDRERIAEHEIRQHDGTENFDPLARASAQAGRGLADEGDSAEDADGESRRAVRLAEESGEDGEARPNAGADGSVEPADAAGRRRGGRSGGVGHDGQGIPEPQLSFTDDEPTEPSRDYRITADSLVGEGSLREKAQLNIEAIRLLKIIEANSREATLEEKHVLARYSGWGAMPAAFDTYTGREDEWNEIRDKLNEILTGDEHDAASASVPNAHYTSPLVVEAIWKGLEHLGLGSGARILEPSIGSGNFFGLMPEALLPKSTRVGVELDSITARIAKLLYPDASIFETGFEDAPFPDNFFDVAIGNVPFGNYGVHDPNYKNYLTGSIHDYFFVKTLDKLRVGGILAFITSRYTLDKKDDDIRQYLASKADLLGAIRLPNTAFKGNAGTVVTTDISFLQKRGPGQEPVGPAWQNVADYVSGEDMFPLNEYYAEKPEMMLGTMQLVGSRYGKQPELIGEINQGLLEVAIAELPRDVYSPRAEPPAARIQPLLGDEGAFVGVKNGAYVVVNNALGIRQDGEFAPLELKPKAEARIRGMMKIRDYVRGVFQTQLADNPEKVVIEARRNLNYAYDSFVREFGCLSNRENSKLFADDPDAPLLISLEENYDEATGKFKKAAIFERPTLDRYKPIVHTDTAAEALAVSLNEHGRIDWYRMASLTGRTAQTLQAELGPLVFENPETGLWETADEYLSGNVRHKLAAARAAAALDKKYQRNVAPLESVQPTDLLPGEIMVRLGSTWVSTDDLGDYVAHVIEANPNAVRVDYLAELGAWTITAKESVKSNVANTTTYGTSRFTAINLLEDAMNGRATTAYDTIQGPDGEKRVVNERATLEAREMQQKLKDKFAEWIWQDSERATRLSAIYNEKFNSLRLRTYDGSHLTFPGMNKTVLRNGDFEPHQKNAVWRILQGNSTLLAHCVGAGKTWIMAAAVMEAKRIGLAKKSMVVVPNHLVNQWGAAFLQLYPQANIFVAGKEHFQSGKRERAMSRIATGTYDAVIVSHKCFELLPVSDDLFDAYMKEELDALEIAIREANADKGNRRIVKILESAKKRLEKRIKDRANREKNDKTITFEELGIDRVLVDEADLYKNLGFMTKMTRVAGLPTSNSNRAADMHIKTRYLRKLNNGKGIVFATGTPISNTMAELYTMQRYLAPEGLAAAGMSQFDAWAANFGEAVTSLELAPTGAGYRMHTRFARFVNLPELLTMFRDFADVQTADMLKLPRPTLEGGRNRIITAPATPALKAYVDELMERAEKIKSRSVDPSEDNMLKITGDGRKAALDMRLIMPSMPDHPQSKVSLATNEIFSVWKATEEKRLTQLAFCDVSTPHKDRFHVYGAIRAGLIERGVPPSEIAFIHDADTDAAKLALYERVNSGRIRILLGSTEKMGAGTNVQRKLYAEHHIDAPWRPRDIEQRDGRILRQGNENEEVRIYRYVTEGSFDAYMWQTLETKARFIQQVMNGDTSVRVAEDRRKGTAMTDKQNPYPTKPGFGLRVHYAKQALEVFGQDEHAPPYSRAFENCFEMFDGDAVVWALMHSAIAKNNGDLAEGIRRMGKDVWPHWLAVYEQRGKYAPKHEQLSLLTDQPRERPKGPTI